MNIIESPSELKQKTLEDFLAKGTVMVFVDSRRDEVKVPSWHKGNPRLALNLDYAFEIPDFKVLEDRIEASLSFNRQRFFCLIPYSALYAISSTFVGQTVIFPADVPHDLLLVNTKEALASKPQEATKPTPVSDTQAPLEPAKSQKPSKSQKTPEAPKKRHLTLIKSDLDS